MIIPFSIYSGCGNEFIVIDNRTPLFPENPHPHASQLCLHTLAADGLILLENSAHHDYKMRIFNADGSEAEMCGNGIRCLMKFIREKGDSRESCSIETLSGPISVTVVDNKIAVSMPPPTDCLWNVPLVLEDLSYVIHFLNTGVPHAVLFVDNLDSKHWMDLAPKIRHHPFFAPHGANVNFASFDGGSVVRVRTYERGVERETGACGTGAAATAIAAAMQYNLPPPITMIPSSKTPLEVNFPLSKNLPFHITLTGPANKIFQGEFVLIEDNWKVT